MAIINIPQWRPNPEQVKIRCTDIRHDMSPNEMVVQFKVNGNSYTLFVMPSMVNVEERTMDAMIIADLDDSGFLIDLPSETLTSGPRIQISQKDAETVIIRG
ncbi:MAG: hypothetical protein BZY87_10670 [SAR202 cluster bacterium Io17-Chloro-G6]|nr:MAG: hypothetical protein BZY87_10670 [SAR202 cluster bacterium Io17-Chloro-G6]